MVHKKIKIALLGFGTVGTSVHELLTQNKKHLLERLPIEIEIKYVCVRDLKKTRVVTPSTLTQDFRAAIRDPEVQAVVEVMGDCPEALDAMRLALSLGKPVVTANKAILAKHGEELFHLADQNGAEILFEASVGGAIPILRCLRESLAANQILSLKGIINGTSNYILSRMTREGANYDDVLCEAQKLGFAEADPSADVDGHDAAAKLSVLIMVAYGRFVPVNAIFTKGIRYLTPLDIRMAKQFGYVIKLLGIAEERNGEIQARVHPTMIPQDRPLAAVNGVFNAIEYVGDYAGEGMLYGKGAGGKPTASAVVSDVLEVTRRLSTGNRVSLDAIGYQPRVWQVAAPADILTLTTAYYLRFSVIDKPQVLAKITRVLADHNISVKHLYQHGQDEHKNIPVIIFTHTACEKNIRAAVKEIDQMDFMTQITKLIRIEDAES